MKPLSGKDIAILSCRILAVYSVISAAKALNYLMILEQLFQGNIRPVTIIPIIMSSSIPSILLFAFGVALWLKAERVAAYMLPDREETSERLALSIEDVQSAAFSVVGVLVLAGAIPQLVQTASSIIIMHSLEYTSRNQWFLPHDIPRLAGLVVQLILGFWLFFGSRGLAGLYRRMREAGLSRVKEDD